MPQLVIEKISYYKWKRLIKSVNAEFNYRIDQHGIESVGMISMDKKILMNYRLLDNDGRKWYTMISRLILDNKGRSYSVHVSQLPRKYFYSLPHDALTQSDFVINE